MAYILPSMSLPASFPSLLSRDQLKRAWATTVTIVCWAVAITFTAGRLTRIGWEAVRPGLARLLHTLALLLDGGLAYPDQPEPDPTPESTRVGLGVLVSSLEHVRAQATGLPAPAATKPRAARRRTTAKAPAKEAAA